jgi:hypothetical protein
VTLTSVSQLKKGSGSEPVSPDAKKVGICEVPEPFFNNLFMLTWSIGKDPASVNVAVVAKLLANGERGLFGGGLGASMSP